MVQILNYKVKQLRRHQCSEMKGKRWNGSVGDEAVSSPLLSTREAHMKVVFYDQVCLPKSGEC